MAQFIWKEWYVEKGVFKDVEVSGVQHLNSNMEAPKGLKNMSVGGMKIMVHLQIDRIFKGNMRINYNKPVDLGVKKLFKAAEQTRDLGGGIWVEISGCWKKNITAIVWKCCIWSTHAQIEIMFSEYDMRIIGSFVNY